MKLCQICNQQAGSDDNLFCIEHRILWMEYLSLNKITQDLPLEETKQHLMEFIKRAKTI